jgi:hypothetical protein
VSDRKNPGRRGIYGRREMEELPNPPKPDTMWHPDQMTWAQPPPRDQWLVGQMRGENISLRKARKIVAEGDKDWYWQGFKWKGKRYPLADVYLAFRRHGPLKLKGK